MTWRSASTENVVIVGGAIVGSFVAYFLQELGFRGQIQIVERDPTYQFSSTARSAAAIRTQFSCTINIRMSLFGADFFRNIENRFGPNADIGFHENGYLILGSPGGAVARSTALAMQVAEGAKVLALDPRQLSARFPWLNVEDLGLSTLGVRSEGWFDAWSMLSLVRNRVRSRGGVYVTAEAQSFVLRGGSIAGVRLSNGQTLAADWCVTAAGAWSGRLMQELGVGLPVSPRKRTVFAVKAPLSDRAFPMVFDTTGAWIRPEGTGFICGISPVAASDPDAHGDYEPQYELFEEAVWPALAHRIPALEQLRIERAWAGHYEMNALDHNAVIGPHDEVSNLIFATGFSGHGVMHSPATGRGVAELILTGRYETLDLSKLGFARIRAEAPMHELSVY